MESLENYLLEADYSSAEFDSKLVNWIVDHSASTTEGLEALQKIKIAGHFSAFDECLLQFKESIEEDVATRLIISRLIREARFSDALATIKSGEVADPLLLGMTFEGLGKWDELLIVGQNLLVDVPSNPWGCRWVSQAHARRHRVTCADCVLQSWVASEVYNARTSFAQNGQDDEVVELLRGFEEGYFVELGACDGIFLSNTFKLEYFFRWDGLLIEPGADDRERIASVRNAAVDDRGVGPDEDMQGYLRTERGPMGDVVDIDCFSESSEVNEIALTTLGRILDEHSAPSQIDFISLDIEGGELEVLRSFDFSKWQVAIWCVEHNYGPTRRIMRELMKEEGYRCLPRGYDDFFVHPEFIKARMCATRHSRFGSRDQTDLSASLKKKTRD